MKKIIIPILIVLTYIGVSNYAEKNNIIPKEALRIRVVANSNSLADQEIKKEVKSNLEPYLYNLLNQASNVDMRRVG